MHVPRDAEFLMERQKLSPMLERLAQHVEVGHGLVDREFEIPEVDGFRHEVEGAPVHCRPDVLHVAVGGHHDRAALGTDRAKFVQQGETVHPGHVDVGHDELDFRVVVESLKSLNAVLSENEAEFLLADSAAEPLSDQGFEVGLVIHHENGAGVNHGRQIISLHRGHRCRGPGRRLKRSGGFR